MSNKEIESLQRSLCRRYDTPYCPTLEGTKLGIILNIKENIIPINGLRHPPEDKTNGWYIWGGEDFSDDPNFFKSIHIEHITEWCPQIQKFLALPPGWRFLIANNYEDVWFDESLLDI